MAPRRLPQNNQPNQPNQSLAFSAVPHFSAHSSEPLNASEIAPQTFRARLGAFVGRLKFNPFIEPTDNVYSAKATGTHKNILLPDGIPVFYLHGTWATTATMKPMIDFIARIQTHHPSYMSYIPEVEKASGIDSVGEAKDILPAYQLATRDMGDLQFQVIGKNLKAIQAILAEKWKTQKTQETALGEFFNILPEEQKLLVPVIQRYFKNNILEASPRMNISQSFASLVDEGVERVRREFKKLALPMDKLEMMDTYLLYNRAMAEGKTINLNMYETYHDPQVINLRPLNLHDVTFLNAYLMFLEDDLAVKLQEAYREAGFSRSETLLKERSKQMAQKLMEAISPKGMVLGHSQGGTVLMSALLKYLSSPKLTAGKSFDLNSPEANLIGARYIGLATLFSSPLQGIPDEPIWSRPLYATLEQCEKKMRSFLHMDSMVNPEKTMTKWLAKKIIWFLFEHNRPAVSEIRASSPFMRQLKNQVDALRGSGVTVISTHDTNDTFVEPEATFLKNQEGEDVPNVFNVGLTLPKVDVTYTEPSDVVETELRRWELPSDGVLAFIVRRLPKRLHLFLYNTYKTSFGGLEQHRALLNHPAKVHMTLGEQLINDPEKQIRLLDTTNFEAVRYQALMTHRKITAHKISGKPIAEALDVLIRFTEEHPVYLERLLENARLGLPFKNSASFEASQLLENLMALMRIVIVENTQKRKAQGIELHHEQAFERALRKISEADLIPNISEGRSLSQQADSLLQALSKKN